MTDGIYSESFLYLFIHKRKSKETIGYWEGEPQVQATTIH